MFNLPFAFAFSAGFVALASPLWRGNAARLHRLLHRLPRGGLRATPGRDKAWASDAGGRHGRSCIPVPVWDVRRRVGHIGHVSCAMPCPTSRLSLVSRLSCSACTWSSLCWVNKRSLTLIPTIGVNWGTGSRGLVSVFLFALAYALATLSCTFPIFLAILAQGQVIGGYAAFIMFLIYGAGMGVGLIGLTLGAAIFKDLIRKVIRQAMPVVEWASPVMLIGAGSYITYYWWVNWFAFNADL